MVTVTARAAEELRSDIQGQTTDPEMGARIVSTAEGRLSLALDKVREGDQVTESEGVKVLLVGAELAEAMAGMVVDCQETAQGPRLTISKLAPGP